MAPKKITVVDTSRNKSKEHVGSQEGYKELLARFGVVCLVGEEGFNENDFESLVDGGIYTLGPLRKQLQRQPATTAVTLATTASEEYKQIVAFVKEEMDNRTKHKPMSEASIPFAGEILKGYGYRYVVDPPIHDDGSTEDPPAYAWKVLDKESVTWKKGEHAGTPGARDWIRSHLLGGDKTYDLKIVSSAALPTLKANRRSASGKGDLAIGIRKNLPYGEDYLFANGIVEMKADEYPLKMAQNLLQLLALSIASHFTTGVALLATDCNKKWEIFYFSNVQTIRRKIYIHGRKALEDFMELIRSSDSRVFEKANALKTVWENDEQNLDGFPLEDRDSKKMKATENEAMLERIADHLGDVYGERPEVPFWARAEFRVPDYYS